MQLWCTVIMRELGFERNRNATLRTNGNLDNKDIVNISSYLR